nr:MAG TPA: hydrolase [Caudoviricetes sp.]
MFIFNLQLFGGGGKKSKVSSIDAKLPTASAEEKELLKGQIGWINGTNQSANTLQGMGDAALGNVITPAYKDMFNQYLGTNQNNQNAIGALQNQVSTAGAQNLTDNTKYANQLAASVDNMNNTASQLANEYSGALLQNQNAMNAITSGQLPTAYQEARQKALNNDLESTLGSAVSGLASRGIINSSQADSAINNISKNASNTLAAQYAQDLNQAAGVNTQALNNNLSGIGAKMGLWGNTYNNQQNGIVNQANLMNQGYTNQMSNAGTAAGLVGQREGLAQNPINTGATTQEAAIQPAKDYYSMAQLNNADQEDLLNRYMTLRYGLASPAQTTVRQGSGGFFGGFMKGFCFVAGTEIATPEGGKAIETFNTGDTVISIDAVNEVIEMHDMGEQETFILATTDCEVTTTASEKVLTVDGLKLVETLEIDEPIMTVHGYQAVTRCEPTGKTEHVFELQCTGDNLFYANGIMAEGINEDELQAIKDELDATGDVEKTTKKTSKKGSKKNTEKVEE